MGNGPLVAYRKDKKEIKAISINTRVRSGPVVDLKGIKNDNFRKSNT